MEVRGDDSLASSTESALQQILGRCSMLLGARGAVEKHEAAQTIRKMMGRSSNPPTDLIVKMGLIRPLIGLLDMDTEETLQFEASWIIGNIAAGSSCHTLAVVAEGALKPLVDLLDSPHVEISQQALWALGNIVADNGHFRNLAFEAGLLPRLLSFAEKQAPQVLRRTAVWVLVNVCRTKNPCLSPDNVVEVLQTIFSVMASHDLSARCDVIWCLVYLSDNSQYLDLILDSTQVLSLLGDLVLDTVDKSVFGLVRLWGNLLSGDESHIEKTISAGCVEKLLLLLDHPSSRIEQEALTCLTSVLLGLPSYAGNLLAFPGLLCRLALFLEHTNFYRKTSQLQREAIWLVASIAQNGGPGSVHVLLDGGVISSLCSVLDTKDLLTLRAALESTADVLKSTLTSGNTEFRSALETCGGFEKIENLQHHDNEIIYQLAYEVLDLVSADDDLDESLLARDAAAHKFDLPVKKERGAHA